MAFAIPENLAPETYPMAWLVDTWRGAGLLEYEGVDASAYLHELRIDNDNGGPYLHIHSNVWLAQEPAGAIDRDIPGGRMYNQLTKGQLWSSCSGYLRQSPNFPDGKDGRYVLEGIVSFAAGHATTWAGFIKGPQFQIVADTIAATPSAATFEGGQIMGGYVESELFYAYDMAAFGADMRPYMSARLQRVSDMDTPGNSPHAENA
ncbi:FABP family protein [Actinotignum urinale]|uniref:FABP family protein n=1 Tax=Actinotignum urinale TaxID=190146 RepID=UPI00370DE0AD